jgi:DNA-binding XRE family transcriptional regulator
MSNTSINHQNWEPVIFKKKEPPKKQIHIDPNYKKMKELENNNGELPIKNDKIPDADRKFIQTFRIQKKLTQDELTVKLSLKKDTIKEIENGKHPKNAQLVNKIKKFLSEYTIPSNV